MPFDSNRTSATSRITFRPPRPSDASRLWRLAHDSGALEANSSYAYALLCTHFGDTCIVADDGTGLAGFVVGYRLPTNVDTLFVWQVTVASSQRRQGLAGRMLHGLLAREELDDVRFLEATVTPSNEASQRLFRAFAERSGAHCEVRPYFTAEMFAEAGHEAEDLYRIGPLTGGPARVR